MCHGSENFKCTQRNCADVVALEKIKKHMIKHGIGDYHCLYCEFGTNKLDQMAGHMADEHSTHLMFIVARSYRRDLSASQVNANKQ